MPQDMVRTEFGKDHGVIHEMVVTGRKVGAAEAFYSALAHSKDLFGKTVEFVTNEGRDITSVPYQEVPAKRALEIVRHGYSHEIVTRHMGWEYPTYLRKTQEVVCLPEALLAQHAEDSILIPMHPNANILAVRSLVEKKRKGSFSNQYGLHDKEDFMRCAWANGWMLMLKDGVPDTYNIGYKSGIEHLVFGQCVPMAFERTFGVMIHYLETDERLMPDSALLCHDEIMAGCFDANGFRIGRYPIIGFNQKGGTLGANWKC